MPIEMKPVQSSQIAEVGYDPASGTLRVRFRDRAGKGGDVIPGALYEYDGITPEHHAAMLGADSIGSHFHRHIRGNRDLAYRRVVEAAGR